MRRSWQQADDVFSGGMRSMTPGLHHDRTAQERQSGVGQIGPLVQQTSAMFNGSALAQSCSWSAQSSRWYRFVLLTTLPIIPAIYRAAIAAALGFSPIATVSIIGTAGRARRRRLARVRPARPVSGLNIDGRHDPRGAPEVHPLQHSAVDRRLDRTAMVL